jgi:uncharacterized protein (DUF2062 family)
MNCNTVILLSFHCQKKVTKKKLGKTMLQRSLKYCRSSRQRITASLQSLLCKNSWQYFIHACPVPAVLPGQHTFYVIKKAGKQKKIWRAV